MTTTTAPEFVPSIVIRDSSGSQLHRLSPQHVRIIVMVADGMSNAEIGGVLFISEDTVKTHLQHVMRNLGARSRAHLVHLAYVLGVLDTRAGRAATPMRTSEVTPGAEERMASLLKSYSDQHLASCELFKIRYCDCRDRRAPEATVQEGHSR